MVFLVIIGKCTLMLQPVTKALKSVFRSNEKKIYIQELLGIMEQYRETSEETFRTIIEK